MNVYLRLVSNNLRTIKTFRLQKTKHFLTEISLKCWYSSAVGQKSLSIQDIKRRAIKNLNQSQDLNGNYDREVDIYECHRRDYYKNIAIFSFFNYLIWVYLVNFCLYWYVNENRTKIKDKSVDNNNNNNDNKNNNNNNSEEKVGFFKDMGQQIYIYRYYLCLSAVSVLLGHLIVAWAIMFTTRVVYHIRLIPSATGADRVRFHCYSPFGLPNTVHKHEILVENISAKRHRLSPTGRYIPLKVKGRPVKFLVDKKGYFSHPMLFDETVGVYRKL